MARLAKRPAVAPHVARKLARYNQEFAKARVEAIDDVFEESPVVIAGRGQYKQWVRPALQRAAWGLRPLPSRVKRRGRAAT
eukprot:12481204-Alexandrium_andersonii.AAC.1